VRGGSSVTRVARPQRYFTSLDPSKDAAMWFTETPWPPIMVFSAIAAGLAAAFVSTQQGRYLVGIVAMLVASLATYLVEGNVVTESERVEQAVYDVAEAFQQGDVDRTLSFFSTRSTIPHLEAAAPLQFSLRDVARYALQIVEVRGDLRITDVSVEMKSGRATSHFRANGQFAVREYGDVGHQPTRWDVVWQKEGTDWKIVKVERLDPITGDTMGYFEESAAREQ
jgi:ketosteroid isomerase-like protein